MAGDYFVKVNGLDELKAAFARSPKIVEPILQRAIVAAQFVLQKHTLKDDPVPWRTGNLLQSFRFFTGRLEARWMPTADYAIYVHEPRENYPGNPYMDKVAQTSEDGVNELFDKALEKITEELAK